MQWVAAPSILMLDLKTPSGFGTSIIGVFQALGANALATRDAVIAKMDELARQYRDRHCELLVEYR
jgi:hypothetical protein